jgi:uncharacterized integral membrane protein
MQEPEPIGQRAPAESPRPTGPDRRERARMIALGLIGAILVVFAVINVNSVEVHWLVTSGRAPLIVVIVLAFLLGFGADRLLVIRARRKAKSPERSSPAG